MSSRTTYQFCNNCGKQGHLYNQCKTVQEKNVKLGQTLLLIRKLLKTND